MAIDLTLYKRSSSYFPFRDLRTQNNPTITASASYTKRTLNYKVGGTAIEVYGTSKANPVPWIPTVAASSITPYYKPLSDTYYIKNNSVMTVNPICVGPDSRDNSCRVFTFTANSNGIPVLNSVHSGNYATIEDYLAAISPANYKSTVEGNVLVSMVGGGGSGGFGGRVNTIEGSGGGGGGGAGFILAHINVPVGYSIVCHRGAGMVSGNASNAAQNCSIVALYNGATLIGALVAENGHPGGGGSGDDGGGGGYGGGTFYTNAISNYWQNVITKRIDMDGAKYVSGYSTALGYWKRVYSNRITIINASSGNWGGYGGSYGLTSGEKRDPQAGYQVPFTSAGSVHNDPASTVTTLYGYIPSAGGAGGGNGRCGGGGGCALYPRGASVSGMPGSGGGAGAQGGNGTIGSGGGGGSWNSGSTTVGGNGGNGCIALYSN